jgi:hypothetical protein
LGGIAGAILGNNGHSHNPLAGAAIGAAAGAIVGGTIGNSVDHQNGTLYNDPYGRRYYAAQQLPPPPPPEQYVVIEQPQAPMPPPPPPQQVVIVAPAAPEYVWIDGYYSWYGRSQGYIWIPGRWEHPPRPGARWAPAHWEPRGGGNVFIEGSWR